jgi:hypothetical protein
LLDLELAYLLGRCGARRAPQEDGEVRHNTQIIVLGLGAKPAHIHVLDHPPAQIGRRRRSNWLGHGRLLCNERSRHPQAAPPKPSNKTCRPNSGIALNTSTNPAQRVRSSADVVEKVDF